MENKEINVVYSCDNKYFLLLLTSIESLIESNKSFKSINFYLLSDGISFDKINIITNTITNKGHKIKVFDVHKLLKDNGLKAVDTYPPSTYSRIFINHIIPENVSKVLYIDADTVVLQDLLELWETPLDDYVILGKSEPIKFINERSKVLKFKYTKYVNAGILLINMIKWKELNAEKILLSKFAESNQKYSFPDQDIISMVLGEYIKDDMPEEYNQFFNVNNYLKAKILHYGGFVARANPRKIKNLYNSFLKNTKVGEQKRLLNTMCKRQLKDKIWTLLKCGYIPVGDRIYNCIMKLADRN